MITQLTQRIMRKVGAMLAVLLVSSLMTGQVHAQWLVTDTAAITANTDGQVAQLAKTAAQYLQQIKQFEAMLTTLKSLDFNLLPTNNQLTIITDPSAQVKQACPGATSLPSMALGALGMDTSLIDGEIVTQQRVICAQIVMLQVDKYNTVAKMLNHMTDYFANLKQLSSTLDGLSNMASSFGSIGNNTALQNQTSQTQAALATEMANVEQHLKAVDATIAALKDQQSLLANIALRGSSSNTLGALGGQLVQAGAFAAAFQQH